MSVKRLGLQANLVSLVTKASLMALVWSGVAVSNGLSKAQTASVFYHLNADSTLEWGCFPPCLCAVMIIEPVKGAFLLTPTGSDGFFNTYAVTDVSWSFTKNGTATSVTGSGTYKVGGNASAQHELSLFLQMNGGQVEHFDSGLVADSTSFPDIKVSISTNRQYCLDTVFNVSASPTPVPQLHIVSSGSNTVVLSWAVSAAPWILEENSALSTANWTMVTNPSTIVGQQNQVILPLSSGSICYRLQPGGN